MKNLFLVTFLFSFQFLMAQVGINTTSPNAQLDIQSTNQAAPNNTDGLLIPKMDVFPAINPTAAQQGMLVYLTTVTTFSGNPKPIGFYYWNNAPADWIAIGNNNTDSWKTAGNSGTNPATNFIGTTDNIDLVFRRGNVQSGRIGNSNIFFGRLSGSVSTGNNNTYIGTEAGRDNIAGQQNVYIGRRSGTFGTTGSDNILIGNGAGIFNEANQNCFLGSFSGNGTTTGANNSFYGNSSGSGNGTGSQNAFFGASAGSLNSSGIGNTIIGTNANLSTNNLANATAIGFNATVGASNSMVLGSINGVNSATATVNVGIGTTIPSERLHVVGNLRMEDGNQAAGKVLTSDANGTASWQNASANAWGLTGNAGLTNLTNFIGTTDARMLLMKTDNIDRMKILANGNIEIGGAPIPNLFEAGIPKLLVGSESSSTDNLIVWAAHSTAAGRSTLNLARQRGSFSTTLPVSNGDGLGELVFSGYSNALGSHLNAASVFADVDGTLAANNVPAKLGFSTAPDTGGSPIERMTIRANGNVGIGTSTPGERFQVAGRSLFTNGFSTDNAALLYRNNTDYMFLGPQSGSSANGGAMALFGSTNVSGGNAGGVDFNVPNGQVRMNHTNGNFNFSANSTSGYNANFEINDVGLQIGHNSASRAVVFRTASTERMRLTAAGDFGIGTTTPAEKLHISGPAGLTAVRIGNTSAIGASSNVALDFFRNTGINTDWRIFNIGANLTIGNSADDLATVNDLYQFQGIRFMPMNDGTQNLGQAANRWNTLFATNGTISTSDRREKKEIQPLQYGLNQLMQLKPVTFKWNNPQIDNSNKHLGFIAQDLQEVLPEVVVDSEWIEVEGQGKVWKKAPLLGVSYAEVIPVLVRSIQEQQTIIDSQKKEIEQQKKLLESVMQRLTKMEQR